ncbi:caveolae-associated protein 1 [Danio rerio]|uniref:Caveolae-associated protein 1 n=1 Tax=Danio rerio TaxID=7955 RepID=E7F0K3_DANRE|nr:polymerase I and transcript release factor [Danio rerio]|eukprot:XP_001920702.1 polymerase I and transcript release factor [Danio rerio]
MADTDFKLERAIFAEVSDDDEEVALVTSAAKPATSLKEFKSRRGDDEDDDDDSEKEVDLVLGPGLDGGDAEKSDATGILVLALLDKIIGVVDKIQQTQTSLEAKQEVMEKNMSSIQTELAKLAKSHVGTAGTVNKLLDKVRKVNVNVKSVRADLEKQVGQIKKLENNEQELLKRKNIKVLIIPEKGKPVKVSKKPAGEEGEQVLSEGGEEEHASEGEEVEVEETIEESRAERIKRSGLQKVDELKKAFSKEQMQKTRQKTKENLEKTRMRTKENLEKTRQRTRENLEKTKKSLGKKMGKFGTKLTPNTERREKIRSSREKMKKSLNPDHTVYARSKSTTYRVPPFTFHVKKIRGGEAEPTPEPEEEDEEQKEEEEEGDLVEEAELVSLDGPEMEAADRSRLAFQETVRPRETAGL